MQNQTSANWALANDILNGVEILLVKSLEAGRPLEIDPSRSRLFELFVAAEGAGYLEKESDPDLSADGLCRVLAQHWDLADAARESVASQEKLPPEQLEKMRMLWSVMRMWMEWSYAWERWREFHPREE